LPRPALGAVSRAPGAAGAAPSLSALLSVEARNLHPEVEMRRIFGHRVVTQGQDREGTGGRHKKGRGTHTHVRRCLLVTPKHSWPSASRQGLGMRPTESPEGQKGQWFTLTHSQEYQDTQRRFLAAVDSLNPNSIVGILNTSPAHIDSLLQLSDICKMGEDQAMAAELIERALYFIEAAFHPLFSPLQGDSHLEYRRQENRSLFVAMFRHIHFVGSRACYLTALSLCKLLVSLDPSDPLAVTLMLDFYALRARQYSWLLSLYTGWESSRNLSQLPNMAFSTALAALHLATETTGSMEDADQRLQTALIAFPSVLLPLLDKCSIEPDSHVMASPFFLDSRGDPPALNTLTTLYVQRAYHCWKEPQVLPWLERNVTEVLRRLEGDETLAAQSRANRNTRYQGLPTSIHRHVIMSEIKEATAALPPGLASGEQIFSWDPLPPSDSLNTYTPPPRQPTNIDDPSALRLFFRSLLPNFNPGDPIDPAQLEGAVGGEQGPRQGADLRNSVNSLLDAMRDLLGNLQLPEVPNDGEDEASEGEGERDREWD